MRNSDLLCVFLIFATSGFDQLDLGGKKEEQRQAVEKARLEAEEAARKIKEAQEKVAAEKKAAEEAAKKAELQRMAEAKAAADAVRVCCDALGKLGFEERSMEYMKATDACVAALNEDKTLADMQDSLKETLGDKPVPGECSKP